MSSSELSFNSVYYVPLKQEVWIGKERELAEAFWGKGVFLADDFIYARIKQWKSAGRPLPDWSHDFSFESMGLGGLGKWEPVPNHIEELKCPHCGAQVNEQVDEVLGGDDESPVTLPEVGCASCGNSMKISDVQSELPFEFSRMHLWVSEVEQDDWDDSFKGTVESVMGPCRVYYSYE